MKHRLSSKQANGGLLRTYSQVVSHLLETYATGILFAEGQIDVIHTTQQTNSDRLHFTDAFEEKVSSEGGL